MYRYQIAPATTFCLGVWQYNRRNWKINLIRPWRYPDDILIKEARALLAGLERAVCGAYGGFRKYLCLCDNMSVVLSLARCRAKSFKLLVVIRRIQALCLARGAFCMPRWIPSELNFTKVVYLEIYFDNFFIVLCHL